jgi:hypothetical protein
MENLREQIFQATDDFLTAIRQLTHRHAESLFQDTFSLLGSAPRASTAGRPRGAKRGPDELGQLSQRFAQFVRDNPGLRIEQINKELGTTTAELALPIRKLVASGAVTVKGEKRSTTYFAGKNIAGEGEDNKRADGGTDASPTPTAGKSGKKRTGLRGRRPRSGSKAKARTRSKGD